MVPIVRTFWSPFGVRGCCCVVLCGMGPLCLLTSTFLTSPFARQVFYDFTDPKALYD